MASVFEGLVRLPVILFIAVKHSLPGWHEINQDMSVAYFMFKSLMGKVQNTCSLAPHRKHYF